MHLPYFSNCNDLDTYIYMEREKGVRMCVDGCAYIDEYIYACLSVSVLCVLRGKSGEGEGLYICACVFTCLCIDVCVWISV